MKDSKCAGPCPPGSFCPRGSLKPRPCGSEDRYCPAGSSAPILADAGAYTTPQAASAWEKPAPYYDTNEGPTYVVGSITEEPYCMASEGDNCTAAAIETVSARARETDATAMKPAEYGAVGTTTCRRQLS